MTPGQRLAKEAAVLIGTRFRLHGRRPEYGLDCIGLLVVALTRAGVTVSDPVGYGLRNLSIEPWLNCAKASSLTDVRGPVIAGDILLVVPGAAQSHILIAESERSFVHAHAGLGKIVRHAADLSWPILRHWRLDR